MFNDELLSTTGMLISGEIEYFTSKGPGTKIHVGDSRAFSFYSPLNTGRSAKDQLIKYVDNIYRSDLMPPWDARILIHDLRPATEDLIREVGYFMAYRFD